MRAKWIWSNTEVREDSYVQFDTRFTYKAGAGAYLYISVDTKYAVYVNGILSAFGQYPDYPWYKIYDRIDLSSFAAVGENTLKIIVYYCGDDGFSTNYDGGPGLWFEMEDKQGGILCCSGEDCLSSLCPQYISGKKEKITEQLGYRIVYDARVAEIKGGMPSVAVEKQGPHYLRPIKNLITSGLKCGELVRECGFIYRGGESEGQKQNEAVFCEKGAAEDGQYFLFDLLEETVGLLYLSGESEEETKLVVGYGEHIADGRVRTAIDGRDFTFTYFAKKGKQEYLCPFMRFAARYIQVFAETKKGIKLQVSLLPVFYPVSVVPFYADDDLCQKIYDVCVRTLQLCMHDHYEDCPWREQALYTLDSRNQMLCGYYAFGKEYFAYARANLKFMGESGKSGLLPITFPSQSDLRIPAFSLFYILAMREYAVYSGDLTLLAEYYERMRGLLLLFAARLEGGLVPNFYGEELLWNFYEWADGLAGKLFAADSKRFDLPLNALFSLALRNMLAICEFLGKSEDKKEYEALFVTINCAINTRFYEGRKGLYKPDK